MTIDVDERPGDIRVVALGGDMDLYASNSVKETVVRLWEAGVRNLVVDPSHLDYVDSSGSATWLYPDSPVVPARGKAS